MISAHAENGDDMIRNPGSSVSDILNSSAIEQGQLVLVAETGVKGSFRLTATNFAGAAQADYFTFALPSGATYAVWLDKDANGTAPTGAAYVAATNKLMASISTGDTAAQVAAAIATAVGVVIGVTDNANGTLDFLAATMGAATAPARHNADDSGNGSLALSLVVAGVNSNHLNKYQKISASDESLYYIYYNVNSEGVDPAPGGTKLEIAVAIADSAATIATAVKSALDGVAKWTTGIVSATLTITDNATGDAADIDAGTGPDAASQLTQGSDASAYGGTAVDSLGNNPSIAG